MRCCRIHVVGRVQGVFFRASTKEKAIGLGLNGWVRNEHDGSVMIEVEGTDSDVAKLIEWCKVGPPMSKVESVQTEELQSQGFVNFEVTY